MGHRQSRTVLSECTLVWGWRICQPGPDTGRAWRTGPRIHSSGLCSSLKGQGGSWAMAGDGDDFRKCTAAGVQSWWFPPGSAHQDPAPLTFLPRAPRAPAPQGQHLPAWWGRAGIGSLSRCHLRLHSGPENAVACRTHLGRFWVVSPETGQLSGVPQGRGFTPASCLSPFATGCGPAWSETLGVFTREPGDPKLGSLLDRRPD